VIEHLEPETGEWLLIEYTSASEIVGKKHLTFTNVKKADDAKKLSKLGTVESKSFVEIFKSQHTVILDPKAETPLTPEDFKGKTAVVIGGILGDQPPKGRTQALLANRIPNATIRNLGKGQFTIDGAVYVAKLVSEGRKLEQFSVKNGLTIRTSRYHSFHVPYAFPLKNGKPVIHKALVEYLRGELNSKNSS
jgi:ribosome biogenesis SPOUT family RNA methylase Rps3